MTKTYRVFENQDGVHDAVPVGFSISGFFFSILWSLFNRLWLLAFILTFCYLLVYISEIPVLTILVSIAISLYIGFRGNGLVADDLLSKGYKEIGTVEASGIDDAIRLIEHPEENTAFQSSDVIKQEEKTEDVPLKPNEIVVKCANCGKEVIVEVKEGEEPDFICPECNTENEIVEEKE